ncbi:MAG: hypothetical protein U1E15_03825 [Hyphomicrobiales bacterium]
MSGGSPVRRHLAWSHGRLEVQLQAGMLGPVHFVLADGREVSPLQVAPWHNDPQRLALPVILQGLRGEWPCVPFGADAERQLPPDWQPQGESCAGADVPHGWSSNNDWHWLDSASDEIALACTYPDDHPIAELRRRIRPVAGKPAVAITLEVGPRRDCRLPLGLHPTFRLPEEVGAVTVEPGQHGKVFSFPGDVEPGASLFPAAAVFENLESVTKRNGQLAYADQLPFADDIEDLLQITGSAGSLALHYRKEGFRAHVRWNAKAFPSVLLWFSNRGRKHYPWNGRHLALGVEPVCSAFDLGPAISCGANPIAQSGTPTAMAFKAGQSAFFDLEISVSPAV